MFFPTWCLGALIADVLSKRILIKKGIFYFIFFVPIGLYLGDKLNNNYLSDFIFGIGIFPIFIFILDGNNNILKSLITKMISKFKIFSPFSYTLYIRHYIS